MFRNGVAEVHLLLVVEYVQSQGGCRDLRRRTCLLRKTRLRKKQNCAESTNTKEFRCHILKSSVIQEIAWRHGTTLTSTGQESLTGKMRISFAPASRNSGD